MTQFETRDSSDRQNFQIFGRPFVKRFALCYQTVVGLSVLSVLSVTLVYCGQTVGWIKMKFGVQVGLGPGHIVLDGDPVLLPKGTQPPPPQFSAPLGMEVGLDPSKIVLDGDPAHSPQKGRGQSPPPNFRSMSIVFKRLGESR